MNARLTLILVVLLVVLGGGALYYQYQETSRRPANHDPGVSRAASGRATRRNNASTGSAPRRARAWKIADFDGGT